MAIQFNDDIITKIINCCQKREAILANSRSMKSYNNYFDKMRKYMRELIENNAEGALLSYLDNDSISTRFDIVILLYNSFPKECRKVLEEISEMNVKNGLPKHLVIVSVAAYNNLKYGIPAEFP